MADVQVQIEAIFRDEYGRILATLISQLGDFSLAEDVLQDALVIALEKWPQEGVPRNPGAWLTTIAKRRAIDRLRRQSAFERNQAAILHDLTDADSEEDDAMIEPIPDDRLKLMFTCCHPALALDAQVALTLRMLGGLSTEEIARAFLVSLPTMAQRLTRAKNKIRDAGIPYSIPPVHQLPQRLDALLAVIYLIFNEGYCSSSGAALVREDLCQEAIRLGRVLVDLLPRDAVYAEARGLLALMLLHDARKAARVNAEGEIVLLEDQNRGLWDTLQIIEGIGLLDEALKLGNPGPYQIQAAISALHAEAESFAATDWPQIALLYRALMERTPSPVIQVNHAVAVGMAEGASVGLRLLLRIEGVEDYYPYHAARADFLRRTLQREAAADAYQKALDLCSNYAERAYLKRRLREMEA